MVSLAIFISFVPLFFGLVFWIGAQSQQTQTADFKKLVQIPCLKGDLNRILKICATYMPGLAVAKPFHNMVLKVKNPWAIDLHFQEGLAALCHRFPRLAAIRWAGRVWFIASILVTFFADPHLIWAFAGYFIAYGFFELAFTRVVRLLQEQELALYWLRNLLYASINRLSDCTNDNNKYYIPVRYRPLEMTVEELTKYQGFQGRFVQDILDRKAAGATPDTASEWEVMEEAIFPRRPEDKI